MIRFPREDFEWDGNYVSFHLHLFSRGSVGISAPKGGYNILTVYPRYLYGGGILEVLPYLREYQLFERMFLLFMCLILASMGIGIIFGQDTFSILWFYGS